MLVFKRRLKRICVCFGLFTVISYIAISWVDPVLIQFVHRHYFGHDIIRGQIVLNENSPRHSFCGENLSIGEMCPKEFYTDLGSCELGENGFDCPDIRHKGTTKLRQAQLTVTRMLRIFDLIAQKHNIPYWITSGTLIGAIRHQGFVPWDDDIDIEIPLMYYIDFVKNFSKELPEDMFFQTSLTDIHYHFPKNRFFGSPFGKYKEIGNYHRGLHPKIRDKSSCYRFCLPRGCKWHDGLQLDFFISDMIPWGIFPLREMLFEGFKVLVPNNWKSIISAKYPDFMNLPREEYRIPDNVRLDPVHSCEELAKRNKWSLGRGATPI